MKYTEILLFKCKWRNILVVFRNSDILTMIKNTEEHSQPKKNTHRLLVLKVTPKIWKPASHQAREITRKYVFYDFRI